MIKTMDVPQASNELISLVEYRVIILLGVTNDSGCRTQQMDSHLLFLDNGFHSNSTRILIVP